MAVLLAITSIGIAEAQQKKVNCSKIPEWVPPPKQSKEEKDKQPKVRLRGDVAVEVNEEGDVVSAKAQPPAKGETADQLESFAKSMKFKSRPGCGDFKFVVHVDIGPH